MGKRRRLKTRDRVHANHEISATIISVQKAIKFLPRSRVEAARNVSPIRNATPIANRTMYEDLVIMAPRFKALAVTRGFSLPGATASRKAGLFPESSACFWSKIQRTARPG